MIIQIRNRKIHIVYLLLFCFLMMSCKRSSSDNLIVFDVTKFAPIRTLDIRDLADIEYLTLDISDNNYLFRSFETMSDNYIICYASGEIFFFNSSTGKPVSKINRKGNGPGEYRLVIRPVYDETKDELFFYDLPEIKCYSMDGTFKRKFPIIKYNFYPTYIYNFDEKHLLIGGIPLSGGSTLQDTTFILVSKQDGLSEVINIPFDERIPLMQMQGKNAVSMPPIYPAILNGKDFLLTDYSSDTVYRFTTDHQLIPTLVRVPSIQKMETKIFLHGWLETSNHLFFTTQLIDYDLNKNTWPPEQGYLMDKKSGQFYRSKILMPDYEGKELIIGPSVIHKTQNPKTGIITWNTLELRNANKEKKLTGKLKEVTDSLTEDDEYVFMILKFK